QSDLTGTKGTDWADPISYALQSGAKGILLISSQAFTPQMRGFFSRGNSFPEKLRDAPPSLPVMLVSPAVGDAILAGESGNRDSTASFAINKNGSMTVASHVET